MMKAHMKLEIMFCNRLLYKQEGGKAHLSVLEYLVQEGILQKHKAVPDHQQQHSANQHKVH
jgi:hypothetical protein